MIQKLTPRRVIPVSPMGEFQRADRGKNKKVKSPSSLKGPKCENLKIPYLSSEMANFDYDFGSE